jgi:plastocyanin
VVAVTAIVVAAALGPTAALPNASGVRHRIDIQRFTFVPQRLLVAPGDTVLWVNHDLVPHTVTAKDGSWDSQTLEVSETWELRVTAQMIGDYVCRFHPAMQGQVRVRREARRQEGDR